MSIEPETNEKRAADSVSEPAAEEVTAAAEETVEEAASAAETVEKSTDAAAEEAEATEPAPKKRRLGAAGIIAILCSLGIVGAIIFALVGHTGAYALKVNDTAYSAAEVNYEYMSVFQQYRQYSQYFGSILPDDEYTMGDTDEYKTWGDFYMAQTKEKLMQLTSLCDMAKRDGVELEEGDTAEIDTWLEQLKASAAQMGTEDFDAFIAENFGEGVNEQVLRDMACREILAMKYVRHYQDNYTVSDEEINDAYEADKDTYDTFRFSYCMVSGTQDDAAQPTEEQLSAAKEKAEAIVAAAQKGDGEALDRLKAAVGEDPDVKVDSAAMDGSTLTQYAVPFEGWIKDASRKAGDMTVSEQPGYGYFVILFEGRERADEPTVNVRHILIQAEDTDGDGNYSEQELAAAKTEIEKINAEWEKGEQTEEAFAALANQYSTDPGSNTNGGLYENIYEGQMVPEFNDFCFAKDRKTGDVEIVPDEQYHGWHLMYFVGTGEPYTNQVIRDQLVSDAMKAFSATLTEGVTVIEGKDIGSVGLTEAFLNTLKNAIPTTTTDGSEITEAPDPSATLEPVTEAEPSAEPSQEP